MYNNRYAILFILNNGIFTKVNSLQKNNKTNRNSVFIILRLIRFRLIIKTKKACFNYL